MRRIAAMATGLLLAGALAGTPAAAEEAENTRGVGVIEEVTLGGIVIGGETFSLGASTQLEDEQGAGLTPAQLPSLAGGDSADASAASYEADEPAANGTRILRHLRLTGAVPK